MTKPMLIALVVTSAFVLTHRRADAVITPFIADSTSNLIEFTTSPEVTAAGVVTSVNFDTHPLGALQGDFYAGIGVTLSQTISDSNVVDDNGPGQGNTGFTPGEGSHDGSPYLRLSNRDLIVSFDEPITGVGLAVHDLFASSSLTVQAFSGPNATGTLLLDANQAYGNLQQDRFLFVGVSDTDQQIRSFRVMHNQVGGDVVGFDSIIFTNEMGTSTVIPGPIAVLGLAGLLGVSRRRRR